MIPYRRPLRCGAPRLLPDHNGAQGDTRYREAYRALVAELGPFSPLQRLEAGRWRWHGAWISRRSAGRTTCTICWSSITSPTACGCAS